MPKIVVMLLVFFVCITSHSFAEEINGCQVNENYDRQDSYGYHYDVTDSSGESIGHLTEQKGLQNSWVIWVKNEGDPNFSFETKIDALTELCNHSSANAGNN